MRKRTRCNSFAQIRQNQRTDGRIFVFWSSSIERKSMNHNKLLFLQCLVYFFPSLRSVSCRFCTSTIFLHSFLSFSNYSSPLFPVTLLPLPCCCQHFLQPPCRFCRCPQSGLTQTWPPPSPHLLPACCLPISSLSNFRSSFWLLS
jgi:hypothetical protein